MKSFNFRSAELLAAEALNLKNNGKSVSMPSVVDAIKSANWAESCRYARMNKGIYESISALDGFELLPAFSLNQYNEGVPGGPYWEARFNGFVIRRYSDGAEFFLNSAKDGKAYLYSTITAAGGYKTELIAPNNMGVITAKKLDCWFDYLTAREAEIKAYNERTTNRTAEAFRRLMMNPNAKMITPNQCRIIDGPIEYTYIGAPTAENGVYREVKIHYSGLAEMSAHLGA